VTFYRDVMGLPLKFETLQWTEFSTEGATLALHLEAAIGGRCRPGLCVPNLDEFHARVVAAGGHCVQEPKEVFGAKIAQYLDPDGLAVSVAEELPAAQPPAESPARAKGAKAPKEAKAPKASKTKRG
jgi:predicted enzyme related to lactoylglutathione lyase